MKDIEWIDNTPNQYPYRMQKKVECPFCKRRIRPVNHKTWKGYRRIRELPDNKITVEHSFVSRCTYYKCQSSFLLYISLPEEPQNSSELKLKAHKPPKEVSFWDYYWWHEPEWIPGGWTQNPSNYAREQKKNKIQNEPTTIINYPLTCALLRASVRDGYTERCYHLYTKTTPNMDDEIRAEFVFDIPLKPPGFLYSHWYHQYNSNRLSIQNALSVLAVFGKVYLPNVMKKYCRGLIVEDLVDTIKFKNYEPSSINKSSWISEMAILYEDFLLKLFKKYYRRFTSEKFQAVINLLRNPVKFQYCAFRLDSSFEHRDNFDYKKYSQFLKRDPSLEEIEWNYIQDITPIALDVTSIISEYVNLLEVAKNKNVTPIMDTSSLQAQPLNMNLNYQKQESLNSSHITAVLSIYLREMFVPQVTSINEVLRIRDKVSCRNALEDFRNTILEWSKELEKDNSKGHHHIVKEIKKANRALSKLVKCKRVNNIATILTAPMAIADALLGSYTSMVPTTISVATILRSLHLSRKFRWHIFGTW